MKSKFVEIGEKVNTDKITHHGYNRFYEKYIDVNITKMLEIGIDNGCSLQLWLNYLPKCYIYGMDIGKEYSGDRYKIIKGDQSNINHLNYLINEIGNNELDLIIDDGSHIPEHQILTFNTFFDKLLKNGGIYIIEDIETSYWIKGGLYGYKTKYGHNHKLNLINVFQNVLHLINREFINTNNINNIISEFIPMHIIDSISTITFGQNCIIIQKKNNNEYVYNDRTYRLHNNI
jgi:hypothetical protein